MKNVRRFERPAPSRKVSLVFNHARLKRPIIEALKEQIVKNLPDSAYLSSGRDLKVVSPGEDHFEI